MGGVFAAEIGLQLQRERKADGNESLGDKAATIGDRTRNAVKDAEDDLHEGSDKLSRDAAYEAGRADEAATRTPR
jgi:hypothetical protein